MLAAGGTGGHLFPALALAEELARRNVAVDLMTDLRGDRYGTDFPARQIYRVPSATISGEKRTILGTARTAMTLGRGILNAYQTLGRVRPGVVVGFGGYPSFPPLVAASLRRIPTALHEQNAVLGRANRMLLNRVSAIATSFAKVRHLDSAGGKARFTGNPVRGAVLDWAAQPYLPPVANGPISLLIFGGSQGARYFSDAVPPAIARMPFAVRQRLRIVQQCREEDLDRVRQAYADSGVAAELATFFRDLPERMAKAHLVIGRAGASSVAELTVLGRPSLLVPLPHAIDNDQLQNASQLAAAGGARCIAQSELTPQRLADEIAQLAGDPDALARMAAAAKAEGRPDAVIRLADLVEELMSRRTVPIGAHAGATN
jgi:UDP-N-acetylglucosamine--N-acetylmuramyl-(pentapeptide) pyrophosphoryl-undecaprenol N-acetylglucosamine transferase